MRRDGTTTRRGALGALPLLVAALAPAPLAGALRAPFRTSTELRRDHACVRTAPFHPRVHNLGNTGPGGAVHASMAAVATRLIDVLAYRGVDMRDELASGMSRLRGEDDSAPAGPGDGVVDRLPRHVVEVGCGVGTLTAPLARHGFVVDAIDTSAEMVGAARRRVASEDVRVAVGNGVDAVPPTDADAAFVVACMVFHELPTRAHREMLRAWTARFSEVWVVDIDPSYKPSAAMLSGEPYVLEYLACIDLTMAEVARDAGVRCESFTLADGRVRGWVLRP